MSARAPSPPIPVTVVGGYLGAGKTSLVNHALRHADGVRFAVLVNDFGDLPIDEDLIESRNDKVISIAGGCVCCSFGSDLVSALFELRDMEPRPEHLLIEASGVALPAMIAESVSLVAEFSLDGILVLADAETVRRRSRQPYSADTITRQLSSADLIVLNKCDLPEAGDLDATEAWLAADFPDAACVRTEGGRLPVDVLTGRCASATRSDERFDPCEARSGRHPSYDTAVLEFPKGVDPTEIARTLAHEANRLLRSKGHVEGLDGGAYTVQTVARRSDVRPSPHGVANVGKIIVIAPQGRATFEELARSLGCRLSGRRHA